MIFAREYVKKMVVLDLFGLGVRYLLDKVIPGCASGIGDKSATAFDRLRFSSPIKIIFVAASV